MLIAIIITLLIMIIILNQEGILISRTKDDKRERKKYETQPLSAELKSLLKLVKLLACTD